MGENNKNTIGIEAMMELYETDNKFADRLNKRIDFLKSDNPLLPMINLTPVEKGFLIDCIYMAAAEGHYHRVNETAAASIFDLERLNGEQIKNLLYMLGASDDIVESIFNL